MDRSKVSFIFDFIFKSLLIFFITFIWLRLYIHNNNLIIILSIIITLLLSFISSFFLRKKFNKIKLTKKEQKEKQEYLNQLNFSNSNKITDFLLNFYQNEKIQKHKDCFVIDKDEKIIVFNNFNIQNCDINFLIECVKKSEKLNINKILVFASFFNKDCFSFIKNIQNFKIKLVDYENFYLNFMKKENIFPTITIKYEEKNRYTFKELISIAFNKKKTKGYIITGLIFLISSIFLRYNIYYIIFTTVMFIFALISYFNKPFNQKQIDNF